MNKTLLVLLAAAIFASGPEIARAATVAINPNADTGLLESPGDANLGASTGPIVGTTAQSFSGRMLFQFDIAGAVPAGSIINSVTLQLTDVSGALTPSASNFELHRMLVNWVEGNKGSAVLRNGATATAGESTWLFRNYNSNFWGTFGGAADVDYSSTISASKLISAGGQTHLWTNTLELVADVQAWLDNPGTNFGWMLLSDGQGNPGTARRFGTRESSTITERPVLTIGFSAVPEPATVALATLGLATLLGAKRGRLGRGPR